MYHERPREARDLTTIVSLDPNTRTLGDPLRASGVLDDPDFKSREVPPTSRLVIASDGIWDCLTENDVAVLIRKIRDPRKASKTICEVGKRNRLYSGLGPDDCSAIVVNLDMGL